jgi:hypothetical protein
LIKQGAQSHHPNGSVPCYGKKITFLGGTNELQFTAKKKKTYYGKCKIQTPRPATAMIGNVC